MIKVSIFWVLMFVASRSLVLPPVEDVVELCRAHGGGVMSKAAVQLVDDKLQQLVLVACVQRQGPEGSSARQTALVAGEENTPLQFEELPVFTAYGFPALSEQLPSTVELLMLCQASARSAGLKGGWLIKVDTVVHVGEKVHDALLYNCFPERPQ